jgi:DNA adenine methylase
MRYQGGKSRIAKDLAIVMSNISSRERERERESSYFVSLFCGSCSVESKVKGFDKKILNDKHEYLIELLNGVKNCYELPEHISEEEYKYIREHKDDDKVLSGFVGFGCSFGGKWYGGYARNKTGTNYALQSKKSLLKDMNNLMDAEFICKDYKDVELPNGCVVYADPPYHGTTGYGKEKFDSEEFWNVMREWSKNNDVYISEYEAPDDFESVLDMPTKTNIRDKTDNVCCRMEKLFKYKG